MAYRCNPCRHTSAPFPIARSEWDMKQNNHFCPDCQSDYILSTIKYPNPPSPRGNCNCGCKPCCCKPACDYKPPAPPIRVNPCYPPHPAVINHPVHPHHCGPSHHQNNPIPPVQNSESSLASIFFFQ
jgi:hypothetical protein